MSISRAKGLMELAAGCVFQIFNASYPDLLHAPVHRAMGSFGSPDKQ
jgi:hypothetical protein